MAIFEGPSRNRNVIIAVALVVALAVLMYLYGGGFNRVPHGCRLKIGGLRDRHAIGSLRTYLSERWLCFSPPKAQHRAARAPVITSPGPLLRRAPPGRGSSPVGAMK